MTRKMTLLFFKETGHVLAALTRAAEAEAEAAALAGEALPVRLAGNPAANGHGGAVVPVESGELDLFTTDYEQGVLLRPRDYSVEKTNGQTTLKPLDRVTTVATDPTAALPALPPLSDNTKVTIKVAAGAVADKTKLWVVLSGPDLDGARPAAGEFNAAGSAVVNVPQLRPDTEYAALVLVVGVWPHLLRFKSKS